MRVVGCFLEYEGKYIILRRHADKPQGGTWALPAGKVEAGETDVQAMVREIQEEIGYTVTEDQLELLGEWSWEYPNFTIDYVTFHMKLSERIPVHLQPEDHSEFQWVTAQECYAMEDLIHNFRDLLEFVGYITPQ